MTENDNAQLLRENRLLLEKLQEAQAIAANMLEKCVAGEPPDKALEAKVCTWVVEMLDA